MRNAAAPRPPHLLPHPQLKRKVVAQVHPLHFRIAPQRIRRACAEYGPVVTPYVMDKKMNLLDIMSEEAVEIQEEHGDDVWYEPIKEVVEQLKKAGYDGWVNDNNIFIFDKAKISYNHENNQLLNRSGCSSAGRPRNAFTNVSWAASSASCWFRNIRARKSYTPSKYCV